MSATLEVLNVLQNSFIGQSVAKSNHLVGATFQVFHVLGFIVLLASVAIVNLRLLGFGLRAQTAPQIAAETNRLIWLGFGFAVLSGIGMFFSAVELYYFNPAFKLKLLILVAATVLQVTLFKKVTATETPNPTLVKLSVLLSVVLWFGVGLAGRAIGYV
jgi:hypothetical protein